MNKAIPLRPSEQVLGRFEVLLEASRSAAFYALDHDDPFSAALGELWNNLADSGDINWDSPAARAALAYAQTEGLA